MGRLFVLDINNACNCKCVGCCQPRVDTKSYDFYLESLKNAVEKGYDRVLFSGGEVTIYPHFFELLAYAREHFDWLGVLSNGRMFAYGSFAEKIAKIGVDDIMINLGGHSAKVHDAWTRSPGSFRECVLGIMKLQSKGVVPSVVYVIWKGNYQFLDAYLGFVKRLGIKLVRIAHLIPTGVGRENFKHIAVNIKDVDFSVLEKHYQDFDKIELEDFPPCAIRDIERKYMNVVLKTTCTFSFEEGKVRSYPGVYMIERGIEINDIQKLECNVPGYQAISESYFERVPECSGCSRRDKCGGFFKAYVEQFGVPAVEPYD